MCCCFVAAAQARLATKEQHMSLILKISLNRASKNPERRQKIPFWVRKNAFSHEKIENLIDRRGNAGRKTFYERKFIV